MVVPLPRRDFFGRAARATAVAFAIPVLASEGAPSAVASSPFGSTFFVSNSGSDSADGLSPETAWSTISRAFSARSVGESTVLFRRGDTFYGELALPAGCAVGAYGTGPKPVVTMYKVLNRAEGWTADSGGIWKINLGSPDTHGGYTETADANIGYLVVDGTVMPAKKDLLSDLDATWDFWCDTLNSTLYVATEANPTTLAADIRAAPRGAQGGIVRCNEGSNTVGDLHITGTGAHGIFGAGADVHVHDCLVDVIGGSFLPDYGDGNVRYGNGIENGIGAKRWLVEDNEIAQVYDAAYTCQGNARDGAGTWEDMTIRHNHIHDCTQSFEFWSMGTNSAAGFRRILVDGNRCERAGYSSFSDVRPNQAVRVHLLTYKWDLPADIVLQNNLFDDADSAYSYHATDPTGLVTRDNTIELRAGTKMEFQRDETVEQAAAWQAATGQEVGSVVNVQL